MLQVSRSFAVGRTRYSRGTLVGADDPVVQGREALFRPAETRADRVSRRTVERATAAPGEVRDLDSRACPDCEFVSRSAVGLGTHIRSKHDG